MTDGLRQTVTFLFTDVEGSTRLWDRDPEGTQAALTRHEDLLRQVVATHGGHLFKVMGDACYAAFADARRAVAAAVDAQLALNAEPWPASVRLRVRIALHSGPARQRNGDYLGPALHHCARLIEAGHGGQILLSRPVLDQSGGVLPPRVALLDLGSHRLRDLTRPERIYQLVHPDLPARFPPLRSLNALPNNLPIRRSSFINRQREMQQVAELLARTPLLTLTGPGGVGKTRLALMVAAAVADEYPDGVWFVDLAPMSEPQLVPRQVASVLGLVEQPARTLEETLVDYLCSRQLLLLLDSCEHLVDAVAQLVQVLIQACSNVRIMATGREPLDIEGELVWPVPGLSTPTAEWMATAGDNRVGEAMQFAAVRLFHERALAVAPGFRLTEENALAVAEICRRLDGIPLAIELAAARVKVLSAQQILDRLDDQLNLLTDGPRAVAPRQQTLRALIDWSYNLLTGPERAVLRRLAVFCNGWSLEAAEAVCAGGEVQPQNVLDLLSALVTKSLVKVTERGGVARHRLQVAVQQYALEKLAAAGEEETIRNRHLLWCLALVKAAEQSARDQDGQRIRLEPELDNLRGALAWGRKLAEDEPEARLEDGTPVAKAVPHLERAVATLRGQTADSLHQTAR